MKKRDISKFSEVGSGGVGTKGKIHVTKATKKMSKRHHRENFDFNMAHATEHMREALHSKKVMDKAGQAAVLPKGTASVIRRLRSA